MRRLRRGPVRLRDERPPNWNEDDEKRHRRARELWQMWTLFWILGAIGTALGFGTVTIGYPLLLWILAALMAIPLGLWTGPSLPDLVRRNENSRQNLRIGRVVTVVLALVGTLAWFGALEWVNSALDFSRPQNATFRVVSATSGQMRAGSFHRVILESNGQRVLLQSGGARYANLKVGQQISLPVGRGLFHIAWVDQSHL